MAGKTRKSFIDPLDPFERGLEAVRSLGGHAKKGVKSESEESAKELLSQLFGLGKSSHESSAKHIDAQEQVQNANGHIEIFNAKFHKPSEKAPIHADKAPKHHKEAAINYHDKFSGKEIVHHREKVSSQEKHEMRRNIEEIKTELAKLVSSSEMLKLQFAEIGVEQTIQNVGTYHLNLFEWMLAVIRSARQKVEDSNAWLGTVKGKGAKKDYWGMFKKHGTTFGLSGERSVATSVG